MVAGGITNVEWLNENQNRKYPFFDTCTMTDSTGTLTLPNELIVDLVFPIYDSGYTLDEFFLGNIVVSASHILLSFEYAATGEIATCSITISTHTENDSYALEGIEAGNFSDSSGRITIGKIDEILDYGGSYSFTTATAFLSPTVIRPGLRGVHGLQLVDANNEESAVIQGDIELIAGNNIQLELEGLNRVRVSAVNNPGYSQKCSCPDEITGDPIKTINGVYPDVFGDLTLVGTGCVEVDNSAVTNGIQLNDTCAQPCCGCAELDVLKNELGRLSTQIATQLAFAERAQSSIELLRDTILSSKFGSVLPC